MIWSFIMLAVGAMLVGGAYSFARQKKPFLAVLGLAATGLLCIAVAYWRIRMG